MAGYVRQSSADIVPTAIVRAAPLNNEYNAIRDAFVLATGHKHDGTAAEGAYVPLISDSNAYNKVLVDSTNNRLSFFVNVSSAASEQVRLAANLLSPVTTDVFSLGTSGLKFKDLFLSGTATVASVVATSATISGGTINGTSIGATTASTGAFTTLSASSTVSGTGFSTYLASPPAIGGTAAAAGSFTTLSASSTVSGTGFSTYLASPPDIGGTVAAAGSFTTLSASSTVSGTGFSTYLASPPAIGGTAAAAGSFTTLNSSGLTASKPVFTDASKNLVSTGTLGADQGGTGQSTYAVGDLLYASASTTLSKLADVATGNALISGGVATAPAWGKIGLTTHVSGQLPIANGGTNSTATATAGGISYGTGTAFAFTAVGTSGQALVSNAASAPTWGAIGIAGGGTNGTATPTAGGIPYGTGTAYAFTAVGTSGQTLVSAAAGAPAWGTLGIAGGGTNSTATATAGGIGYGTGTAHAYTAVGTTGQTLISAAGSAPAWGTLGVAGGGTGQTSYAVGDLLYASTTSALSKLADVATGNALISGGVGVAPSWGKIALTTHVSGQLPVANGGTGASSASAGFSALSPMTTLGDVIYGAASGVGTRLAGNTTTTKQFLSQTGDGTVSAAPAWSTVSKSDVGLGSVENTALSTWAGSTNITTLGTITSGTWSGTTIAVAKGGLNLTSIAALSIPVANTANTYTTVTPTANQSIRINSAGSAWEAYTPASQVRVLPSIANTATPTLNTDNYDMMVITGQTVAITSFTTNLTGAPINGQKLIISITGTSAIAITWGVSFEASNAVALPSTTTGSTRLDVGFIWNAATNKWRCVASA